MTATALPSDYFGRRDLIKPYPIMPKCCAHDESRRCDKEGIWASVYFREKDKAWYATGEHCYDHASKMMPVLRGNDDNWLLVRVDVIGRSRCRQCNARTMGSWSCGCCNECHESKSCESKGEKQ